MKQGIVKKLNEAGRNAMTLFVKLNGLGMIGFVNHNNDKTDKKILAVTGLNKTRGKQVE